MLGVAKRPNQVVPAPRRSLFDEVVGDVFGQWPFAPVDLTDYRDDDSIRVAELDQMDDPGRIEVEFVVPGYKKEQLSVEFNEGVLTLKGDKGNTGITKSVAINKEVDFDKATAVYDAGILTVTLPKIEAARRKRTIPIS